MMGRFRDYWGRFRAAIMGTRKVTGDAKSGARSYLAGLDITPWNPDDYVRFKGRGLYPYQDFAQRESYVATALDLKTAKAIQYGIEVEPASDAPRDQEVAEFVRAALKQVKGGVPDLLRNMGTGLWAGFSLGELVWRISESGVTKGKAILDCVDWKDANAFELLTDRNRQLYGVIEADWSNRDDPHPIEWFVHWAHNSFFGNPYGRSDLRRVSRAAWLYDTVIKLRARYVEKFAIPFVIGTTDDASPIDNETEEDAFYDALKSLQEDAVLRLWDGQSVEIVSAVTDHGAYETLLQRLVNEMLVGILGSHLAISEGALQGAKAAAETHQDTTEILVGMVRESMMAAFNAQVIRPLVWMNFQNLDAYPEVYLRESHGKARETVEQEGLELDNDRKFLELGGKMTIGDLHRRHERPLPPGVDESELLKSGSTQADADAMTSALTGRPGPFDDPTPDDEDDAGSLAAMGPEAFEAFIEDVTDGMSPDAAALARLNFEREARAERISQASFESRVRNAAVLMFDEMRKKKAQQKPSTSRRRSTP